MLIAGILLFVYNIVPDSPLNHLRDNERRLYNRQLATGRIPPGSGSGYYWPKQNVALAAIGAALVVVALTESRRDRF
jgi:hypothetical protein